VNVTDTSSLVGLGTIDLYYLIDISWSFRDEWRTMERNLTYIEKEIEAATGRDIDSRVRGLNNSYLAGAGSRSMCPPGQDNKTMDYDGDGDTETIRVCDGYTPIIDDVSNVDAYVTFINEEFGRSLIANPQLPAGAYNPLQQSIGGTQPTHESPREGWGVGMLQIIQNSEWRENSARVIINIGDQDTNGGNESHSRQGSNCGGPYATAVANNLTMAVQNKNITTYSLIGDSECGSPPNPAYQEMRQVSDELLEYNDAKELPPKIIDRLEEINATGCKYKITDAGTGRTTGWETRGCPDGNLTVSVGPPGSGATCTTQGRNTCIVQTQVNNTAGYVDRDMKRFNIDYSPPNVSCQDCENPDPVMIGRKVSFEPNVTDRPQPDSAGLANVTICKDSTCNQLYCRFTAASPTNSCSYTTSFDDGYGPRSYCVKATDTLGTGQTVCDPSLRFKILAGPGDPCDTDQQCMIGVCDQGVCKAERLPPPRIILR